MSTQQADGRAEFERWQRMARRVLGGGTLTPERVDRVYAALRASGAPESVACWIRIATGMQRTPREDHFFAEMRSGTPSDKHDADDMQAMG